MRILKENECINYWCTWLSQNELYKILTAEKQKNAPNGLFEGDQGAQGARAVLNEQTLFCEDGFAAQWNEEIRKNLLLMLDDGWDVEYGVHPDKNLHLFGSLKLSEQRFPSFKGNNAERLKQLNDAIKNLGWKGIGLWVSAQPASPLFSEEYNEKSLKKYYAERVLESKQAGITYWKVDWGKYAANARFRKLLTDTGHELYPELIIEHANCCPPINGIVNEGKIRYADETEHLKLDKEFCEITDVFRSYDVTDNKLSAVSTLDRLSQLLSFNKGFTNCEDEVLIGAALGCSLGIMRSSYARNTDMGRRLNEVTAALRWQQIAPPFTGGALRISEQTLTDECLFASNDTWYAPAVGRVIKQAAPAVTARNTKLPTVISVGHLPFVIASKNPNGVYSIAAVNRYKYRGDTSAPTVAFDTKKAAIIGVFGNFDTIKLQNAKSKRLSVTNLYSNATKDVTQYAHFENDAVILPIKPFKDFLRSDDLSQSAFYVTLED